MHNIYCIQMLHRTREESIIHSNQLNIDPGSNTTGMAVTSDQGETRRVLTTIHVQHRGELVKLRLTQRRNQRRSRRGRLRNRKPRFLNRSKPKGWLPPSLLSRLNNILTWTNRITRIYPINGIRIETAKFDTQKMINPEIQGIEYQRGTLWGTQIRAFILHRDGHKCTYCNRKNSRLTLDHVRPKSKSGTNRPSNLVPFPLEYALYRIPVSPARHSRASGNPELEVTFQYRQDHLETVLATACLECNRKKNKNSIEEFLKDNPDRLKKVLAQLKQPLSGATHTNLMIPTLIRKLENTGRAVTKTDAATTKYNRERLGLEKDHATDAAVLEAPERIDELPEKILNIRATGRGRRCRLGKSKNGLPCGRAYKEWQRLTPRERRKTPTPGYSSRNHETNGVRTGDTVRFFHPKSQRTLTGYATISDGRVRLKQRGEAKLSAQTGKTQVLYQAHGYRLEITKKK